MKLSLLALLLIHSLTSVQAFYCCYYGDPGKCERSLGGVTYVEQNWVPAVRHESDRVIRSVDELTERDVCCCRAGTADECAAEGC